MSIFNSRWRTTDEENVWEGCHDSPSTLSSRVARGVSLEATVASSNAAARSSSALRATFAERPSTSALMDSRQFVVFGRPPRGTSVRPER